MQEFCKGQKFYYIDSETHKKIYLVLLGIKDDVLYLKDEKGHKYAVEKSYVNKTLFVSLLADKQKRRNDKPIHSSVNPDEKLGKYAAKNRSVNKPKSNKKRKKKKAVVVPDADSIVLPAYVPSKYAGNHHRSARPKGQSKKAVKQYEELGKAGLQKEDDWSKYDNKIPKW